MTPPPRITQHLVATDADAIPQLEAASLRDFCGRTPGVEAGYVCRVAGIALGADAHQRVAFAVKLSTPVAEPGDGASAASRNVLTRYSSELPDLAKRLGLTVLADRAVAHWDANALRVY
jgi:hypothetical protein